MALEEEEAHDHAKWIGFRISTIKTSNSINKHLFN
jgi:hypothetical protein